ncbi:DNA-directed RNA polymerase II subunit 4 [Olea europaea subsp. europaea]|uniref:DNA-directed RNA polymerase II subunit 4 n=1 Tax=Olea europaea subsp. europaea TaxID=158383 RepID=A0A8S0UPF9_OLEEU|nr:DNA-directed RNA polymerase II subunit 4 [Olea europaea subsp. europaea]
MNILVFLCNLLNMQLSVLGNLCPETIGEALSMVPSIKTRGQAHDDYAIEKMLNDLSDQKIQISVILLCNLV